MARLKHRPSSPQDGFRPIQLSRQEISRQREESNRRVANMERNRQAELQQREAFLRSMKEDAAYTDRQQQRNFEIQQQNLQAELIQQQLDAKTQQTQGQINQKEVQQIFGGLASLSKSAAQIIAEQKLQEEKRKEDLDRAQVATGTDDPEKAVRFLDAETGLITTADELYKANIREQEANGGDPNAIARGREANPAQTYKQNTSTGNWLITHQYPVYGDQLLNSNTQVEYNGQMYSMSAAKSNPRLMQAVLQAGLNQFIKGKNINLDPRALRSGLQAAVEYQNAKVRAASQEEIKQSYQRQDQSTLATIVNQPDQFQQRIGSAFTTWSDIPYVGFAGALDRVEQLGTVLNSDGSGFLFPLEVIGEAVLKPDGKPFREAFPVRFQKMKEARVNDELKRARREFAIDDVVYQTDVKRIVTGLTDDPSQANADKAVEFFRDTYGKVPSEISKFQASYTIEAVDKIKRAKQLLAIPKGFMTLEAVEAGEALDADTGREMRSRLVEQEKPFTSGIFKETSEAFKTTANGVTAMGSTKDNTSASVFLQQQMRGVYRKRVEDAVAGGAEFNQAATTIGQQLDQEVRQGANNPESIWYRKVTPGGIPTFPNLNKGMVSAVERANRRFTELKKQIKTEGLQKTIDTKDSILTTQEAQALVNNYGKSSFVVPQDVLAVSGMSNGLDPMVIINRQLQAQGMQPLAPPPSLATTSQLVSPAFQKLLYKSPSVNRSARGLGTSNTFNPAIVPNNLGETVQLDSKVTGLNPAYLSALGEIHGDYTPEVVAKYRDLFARSGSPVAAAISFFADQGFVGSALLQKQKEFAIAMYKYGGGIEALQGMRRNGFTNKMVQLVHGNEAMKAYRGGKDGRAVFYDEALHSGANEHVHAQLQTKDDVAALKQLASTTIDPFSGMPYRITSELRPGDPGAHGSGLALDIAPPVSLPVEHEAAWYHEFFRQMGMNPFQIK